jgi:hypothetical protein
MSYSEQSEQSKFNGVDDEVKLVNEDIVDPLADDGNDTSDDDGSDAGDESNTSDDESNTSDDDESDAGDDDGSDAGDGDGSDAGDDDESDFIDEEDTEGLFEFDEVHEFISALDKYPESCVTIFAQMLYSCGNCLTAKIVQKFMKKGLDLNHRSNAYRTDRTGMRITPLEHCCEYRRDKDIRVLVSMGAKITEQSVIDVLEGYSPYQRTDSCG